MYTSTKSGDWDSIYSLLDYLELAFESLKVHANTALEIEWRVRELGRDLAGDGPVRPPSEESVHVRHLRNVQPMQRGVAEGVQAYGDLLEYARIRLRGELIDEEETGTEVGKHLAAAIQPLEDGATDTARKHVVEALKLLRGMRGVDAGLEMAGYGDLRVLKELDADTEEVA